ncbi:hypothetical protein FRC04_003068 [Tulasnella sp. 424]|nr:hypothetical protein FRC04_003068 [Tulasnella sp. 424]KAG8981141.1 hypothetical protein FRC05_004041 [Tulasnella sp. 425]
MNALTKFSFLYPPRLVHASTVARALSSLSSPSYGAVLRAPRATRGLATRWAEDPLNETSSVRSPSVRLNNTTKPSRSKSKRPAATPSDISSAPPAQLDQRLQLSDRNTPGTLRDVEQLAVSMLASFSQSLQAKNEQSAKQLWEYGSKTVLTRLASSPPPTPYTGRSVAVNGQNFAYAYRELNGILRDNNVRRTIRGQERHEKKGVKRRRIVSQTHRRKFGQLVRSKVAMVKKIRALGS